ncbi:MAG TPA: PAS domain S-box protein [Methanoregula sp.]|nr:PAS domain S-box protein [Methanoregula sp.]
MNLQEKTVLVLVILLIALIAVISVFVSSILLSSYTSLDSDYAQKDIIQAVNQMNSEKSDLSSIVADWGPWDDTYDFANGTRPDYVSTNLIPENYNNLRLNLFVIADPRGNILYSGAYDLQNKTMVPVPAYFTHPLRPSDPLLNTTNVYSSVSGFILLPEYPMVVASRPITRSDYTGTPDGVVIIGRAIDSNEVGSLAALTQPDLKVIRADDPSLSPALLASLHAEPDLVPRLVGALDRNTIEGDALVRDIYGNDAFILRLQEPRTVFLEGSGTILQFIIIILASGLIFGLVMLVFLDRNVLSRLGSLSHQVYTIGRDTDFSRRVAVKGDDELAGLEREINRMLSKIEKSHSELQESEVRFRELSDLLPQIIFEMDAGANLTYVNKFGLGIFGLTSESLVGLNARRFLIAADVGKMQANLVKVAAGIRSTGDVYSLITRDGSIIRAIIYTSAIIHEGKLEGFRGSAIDITERLRLQEALAEDEEYLKTLLATVQVGILVVDATTQKIIDANPAALSLIGTTLEDLLRRTSRDVIRPGGENPADDRKEARRTDSSEEVLVTGDGRSIPVIRYVAPVTLHGKPCLLETFIDISYRKRIEQQLKESEEKYRALTENTPDVLFSTDIEGKITYVSPQVNQYGFLSEEIVGRSLFDLLHPEDRQEVAENFTRELSEHAQFSATFRMPDKWGHIHWFEEKSFLQLDAYGKQQGVYGIFRDITERQRAEEAIELANKKLNLMNNITRHDILNTITGLLGCVDMAKATAMAEERSQLLDDIKELARVIQRQINFTKQYQEVGVHLPLWQNVGDVVRRILVNFESSGIRFAIDLEKVEIYADPLLEKVFYNLVDNAIRYGKTITTIRFFFLISDRGLSLICEDDGVGISDEYKHHIFERGVGQNTGMGLFLSREILGITRIEIEENGVYGKGARFEILFPRGTFRFGREPDGRR